MRHAVRPFVALHQQFSSTSDFLAPRRPRLSQCLQGMVERVHSHCNNQSHIQTLRSSQHSNACRGFVEIAVAFATETRDGKSWISKLHTVSSQNQHVQPALQQGCCVTVWQHWNGGNQLCNSSADGWVAEQASAFSLLPSDFCRGGRVGRLYLCNLLQLAHHFDGGGNVIFLDSLHGLDVEICCVL